MNHVQEKDLILVSRIITPIWSRVCKKLPRHRIHAYSMLNPCQKEYFINSINISDIMTESIRVGENSHESHSYILVHRLAGFKYHVVPFLLTVFRINIPIYNELKTSAIFSSRDLKEVETYNETIKKYTSVFKRDMNFTEDWSMFSRLLGVDPNYIRTLVYKLISKLKKTKFLIDICNRVDTGVSLLEILKILDDKGLKQTVQYILQNFNGFPKRDSLDEYVLIELIKPNIDTIIKGLNLYSRIYNYYIVRLKIKDKHRLLMLMKFFKSIDYVTKTDIVYAVDHLETTVNLVQQIKKI